MKEKMSQILPNVPNYARKMKSILTGQKTEIFLKNREEFGTLGRIWDIFGIIIYILIRLKYKSNIYN
jgi:hypothetical protein